MDENKGIPATMLVGPTGYGGYPVYQNGGNDGGFGGDWGWIVLLLLLCGGGRNQRRDSMGRYSGEYSGEDDYLNNLYEMLEKAPDEKSRQNIQRMIREME